jgi:3-dehydroquinate dehydratase / shikimate dehydrogenase
MAAIPGDNQYPEAPGPVGPTRTYRRTPAMICISVTPKSRKLAKADLLNAARHADMVELCLDHLIKQPDVADLISAVNKPLLVSCRRKEDGGEWAGSEDERLQLLRQAIVAGPAFVELELDVATKIKRYGDTKRVVSYTSTNEPGNVVEIYTQAAAADADVVKFSWPTRTLDATRPLLAAVTQKRNPPIVGTGLGRAGLMFSLLGCKYGSPWLYAALEKGMEAYPGQPTIWELNDLYGWRSIDAKTRFVGICGFGSPETKTVRVLNAAFDRLKLNGRCLPLAWGDTARLPAMLGELKIRSLIVNPEMAGHVPEIADVAEEAVTAANYCDVFLNRNDQWQAFNTLWRSTLRVVQRSLADMHDPPLPEGQEFDRTNVLVIGANPAARSIIYGFQRKTDTISISDPDDRAAAEIAKSFGVRHVRFAAIYEALADVLVFAHPAITIGHRKTELNPSILRPPQTVVDVSQLPDSSDFVREARERGCRVVEPRAIFDDWIAARFKAIAGAEFPAEVLQSVLPDHASI